MYYSCLLYLTTLIFVLASLDICSLGYIHFISLYQVITGAATLTLFHKHIMPPCFWKDMHSKFACSHFQVALVKVFVYVVKFTYSCEQDIRIYICVYYVVCRIYVKYMQICLARETTVYTTQATKSLNLIIPHYTSPILLRKLPYCSPLSQR